MIQRVAAACVSTAERQVPEVGLLQTLRALRVVAKRKARVGTQRCQPLSTAAKDALNLVPAVRVSLVGAILDIRSFEQTVVRTTRGVNSNRSSAMRSCYQMTSLRPGRSGRPIKSTQQPSISRSPTPPPVQLPTMLGLCCCDTQ